MTVEAPKARTIFRIQRILLTTGISATLVAHSAIAQTVSGAIDPSTGLNTLSTYVLGLVSSVMVIVAAWKGTHAFMEGRSIGPIAVGLLAGLVLAFGGYYIMQHYGVTSTSST